MSAVMHALFRWSAGLVLLSVVTNSRAVDYPYPLLQAQLSELMATELDDRAAPELSEDPEEAAAERLQLTLFQLFVAHDLDGVTAAIKRDPAAFARLGDNQLGFMLPTLSYSFTDRARVLEWGEQELLPLLNPEERESAVEMALEYRIVDALLQRDPSTARKKMQSHVQALKQRCQDSTEDISTYRCRKFRDAKKELESLEDRLHNPQQSTQIQLPLNAKPLVVDLNRPKCSMYGMVRLVVGMSVDKVNIAMGFGDLDSAIEIALRLHELGGMDPRLPDLLLNRYGENRIKREFAQAEANIQERQLPAGRLVFTTLFGHELRLPSAQIEEHTEQKLSEKNIIITETNTTTTEYTTLAQHQQNFRATELYRALFETE